MDESIVSTGLSFGRFLPGFFPLDGLVDRRTIPVGRRNDAGAWRGHWSDGAVGLIGPGVSVDLAKDFFGQSHGIAALFATDAWTSGSANTLEKIGLL